MTADAITTLTTAMRATGCTTVGDLVDYCREHRTTPQAIAEQAGA